MAERYAPAPRVYQADRTPIGRAFAVGLCQMVALIPLGLKPQGMALQAPPAPAPDAVPSPDADPLGAVLSITPRKVVEPVAAGEWTLPPGVHVTPCLYLAHRRPELWEQRGEFRLRDFQPLQALELRLDAARSGTSPAAS